MVLTAGGPRGLAALEGWWAPSKEGYRGRLEGGFRVGENRERRRRRKWCNRSGGSSEKRMKVWEIQQHNCILMKC